jgi:hypothetical protein
VTLRTYRVLDAAPLQRRSVIVLELDAPSPLVGVAPGMPIELLFADGTRERVELKSVGFASSTPDHAHVIINVPSRENAPAIESIELEELPAAPPAKPRR